MVEVHGRGLLLVCHLTLLVGGNRGSCGGRIRWVFLEARGCCVGDRVGLDGGSLEMGRGGRGDRIRDWACCGSSCGGGGDGLVLELMLMKDEVLVTDTLTSIQ